MTAMSEQTTLFGLLKRYNPDTFPVIPSNPEEFDEIPQDGNIRPDDVARSELGEYATRLRDEITNVLDRAGPPIARSSSPLIYFLDGCRRAYYLCDMATPSGSMVPILAGQISSAVLERSRETGRVSLRRHENRGLLLLPVGGAGINQEDASAIKEVVDRSFPRQKLNVMFIKLRHEEEPRNDALARLNTEMQSLEVSFLEEMANEGTIQQRSMIVVDGALQFQRVRDERRACLRYAIGISKRFNLHLKGMVGRTHEIGAHLIKLRHVGDRTSAFLLKEQHSGTRYAFWYLRIQPMERMPFPFAGIVKVEKVLVDQREREDGLSRDVVDNISRFVLLERTVSPYGVDFRWASHIYPIYLTEQLQRRKFVSDHFYRTLLKRKVQL
ncbi:MAG: hypothetical protein C4576_00480 [Desulfobacteraceae bacterium]|nr:MAG: hypothetical protein C4576_00480 [Desulfobacteraceae bacterium]